MIEQYLGVGRGARLRRPGRGGLVFRVFMAWFRAAGR